MNSLVLPNQLCRVCDSSTRALFRAQVLGKYDAAMMYCEACGFLAAENPHWLEEAYSDAIVATDSGIAARNLDATGRAAGVFLSLVGGKGTYVDLAGGYGLFTRLMRDIGFDCYWSDPYARNLFARGFEMSGGSDLKYSGATAFEVLEHVPNPVAFIRDAFAMTRCEVLLVSTELYAGREPPRSWWYYDFECGQHISFFHARTLDRLANLLGLHVVSSGSYHLFSRQKVSRALFWSLNTRIVRKAMPYIARVALGSRVVGDHMALVGRRREQ